MNRPTSSKLVALVGAASVWSACSGSRGAARGAPGCDGDAVLRDGECVACPAGQRARGGECVRPDRVAARPGGLLGAGALGADWHPDPDGDGVPTPDDVCPHVHDPAQGDADGDGLGDACDPDVAAAVAARAGGARPPTDPIDDLRIEHVTPYGAWLAFTSTRTAEYKWYAGIAWSEDPADLAGPAAVARVVARGDAVPLVVEARAGERVGPVIVTALTPGKRYHLAAFERDYKDRVLSVGAPVAFDTAPEPRPRLGGPRPRVLATPEHLDALRARRARGDAVYERWSSATSPLARHAALGTRRVYQPLWYCPLAAVLYHVGQSRKQLEVARKLLDQVIARFEAEALRGNAYRAEGSSLAICLDLLWDHVDPGTRARAVVAYLADDASHAHLNDRIDDTDQYVANTEVLLVNGLVGCNADGLPSALSSAACANLEVAKRRWFGVLLVQARRARGKYGHSGGYLPDGSDYGQGTSTHWMRAFLALHHAGVPIGEYRHFLRNVLLAHWLHPLTPGMKGFATVGDVSDFSANGDEPGSSPLEPQHAGHLALTMGALDAAGLADEARWARRLMGKCRQPAQHDRVYNLLYEDGARPPLDWRETLPEAYLASGFGVLFDRTSWRPGASYLVMRAGWSGVDHTHGDAGHFQLYRRGRWITRESIGYDGAAATAAAHNVLALEIGLGKRGGAIDQYRLEPAHTRGFIRAGAGAAHTFAVADTTGVYRSHRYKSYGYDAVQRSILWLKGDERARPDVAVVYDLVDVAADAPATGGKRLAFHFDAAPRLGGDGGGGRRAVVVVPGGPRAQRAVLDVVMPATARLSHAPPEGEPDKYPSSIYTHRVVVDPASDARALRVVSVLHVADASGGDGAGDAPPAPRAVAVGEAGAAGAFRGVVVGGDAVVFPAAPVRGALVGADRAELAVPASAPVRLWLSGLMPGASLGVTASPAASSVAVRVAPGGPLRADAAGLLAVAIAADGSVAPVYGAPAE